MPWSYAIRSPRTKIISIIACTSLVHPTKVKMPPKCEVSVVGICLISSKLTPNSEINNYDDVLKSLLYLPHPFLR